MTLDALDDRGWDDHGRDDCEHDVHQHNTLRWTSEHCGVDTAERFVITAWVRSWLAFVPPRTRWPLLPAESGRTRIAVHRRSWLADNTLHSLPEDSLQHLASAGVIGAGGVKSGWWTLGLRFEACSSMACFCWVMGVAEPDCARTASKSTLALMNPITRVLAVIALALLGPSPLLTCSRLSLVREGGASVALALVLDDSMSMDALDDGTPSRFAQAIQEARYPLAIAQTSDSVAVVLAGEPARVAVAPTTDLDLAKRPPRTLCHQIGPLIWMARWPSLHRW